MGVPLRERAPGSPSPNELGPIRSRSPARRGEPYGAPPHLRKLEGCKILGDGRNVVSDATGTDMRVVDGEASESERALFEFLGTAGRK